jgi:O-methyltransferase
MTPAEANVRKFRQAQAQQKICGSGLPEATASDRWQLLEIAIAHIGPETPITLLEFGVAKGQSMAVMAKRFVNKESRFIGFDSFEGLPEDWDVIHQKITKGTFSTGGNIPRIADKRVSFVRGWFQNTVSEFLKGFDGSGTLLIHYDADLYSSTLFLLTTIWHFVPYYYFIMDDFSHDEVIALHDFSLAYPVKIEWLAKRTNPQRTPVQMFGRMMRTELKIA